MTAQETIDYFNEKSDKELTQLVNELNFTTWDDNSPLRTAAKDIYGDKYTMLHVISLGVPLANVLLSRLEAAKFVIENVKLD